MLGITRYIDHPSVAHAGIGHVIRHLIRITFDAAPIAHVFGILAKYAFRTAVVRDLVGRALSAQRVLHLHNRRHLALGALLALALTHEIEPASVSPSLLEQFADQNSVWHERVRSDYHNTNRKPHFGRVTIKEFVHSVLIC